MAIQVNKTNPILRLTPRPNEANSRGDIFGGWLMAQYDLAGMLVGARQVNSLFATVAVKEMTFKQPIFPYDEVSIYGEIVERGHTSFMVALAAYLTRAGNYDGEEILVSTAEIVYATIKNPGEKNEQAIFRD